MHITSNSSFRSVVIKPLVSFTMSEAPVDFPFRPGRDVLPGKGEWFKRNNVFFRDKVGELSDLYDTCTKVTEKREIARLVVEAVYGNGGRFLDSDGQDIGFKRSMDKAMKALKDRRHIKSRKINGPKPAQGQEAIRRTLEAKRAGIDPNFWLKKEKGPLSTDSAGHALLLLRGNAEEGIDKSRERDEDRTRTIPPPRMTDAQTLDRRASLSAILQNSMRQEKPRDNVVGVYQLSSSAPAPTGTAEQPKGSGAGDAPVIWQSVIVSRESPQASLAEMLVNAKQRLDALSSIQQAVSAPICLIYPPSPNFSLTGQVSLGQATATPAPVNAEFASMIPEVSQVSLQG